MPILKSVLAFIRLFMPAILLLLFGVGVFFGLGLLKQDPGKRQMTVDPPLVETVSVRDFSGELELEVDGEVVPFREIALAAEVAGRVEKKYEACEAGLYVRAGEPLLVIDSADYDFAVAELDQSLLQAEELINESRVELGNLDSLIKLADEQLQLQQRELARIEELEKTGVIDQSTADKTRREEVTTRNSLRTLENQASLLKARIKRLEKDRDRAKVQRDRAKLDVERTKIDAPISGIVTADLVQSDDYVQRGTLLARVEDTSRVEVRALLRFDELRWLWARFGNGPKPGEAMSYNLPRVPVDVVLDVNGQEFIWKGRLSRYDGTGISSATRTIPILIEVADPQDVHVPSDANVVGAPPALMRGTFVTLRLRVNSEVPLLEIPAKALQPGGKVWVFRKPPPETVAKPDVQNTADQKQKEPSQEELAKAEAKKAKGEQQGVLDVVAVDVARAMRDRILVYNSSELSPGDRVIVSPLTPAIERMRLRMHSKVEGTPKTSDAVASVGDGS